MNALQNMNFKCISEHNYLVLVCAQMEATLEKLSAQEKAIASVGTTVAQTEQLLIDLEMLETTAEV